MASVDLNCDMGEGVGNDEQIMPYISSASIACGYHAGDEGIMKRTIELALQHGVAIGAHPSFNDRQHFGRTEMHVSEPELYDVIVTQLHLLKQIAVSFNAKLHHVKPHGALYNMAARDAMISHTIAKAVKDVDAGLIVYGLSGSNLISAAEKQGLRAASEVFADRMYTAEGSLVPRSQANALIDDEQRSLQQVMEMVIHGSVTAASGKVIPIKADTICIHGDGKHAVSFAKAIRHALKQQGIDIKTI